MIPLDHSTKLVSSAKTKLFSHPRRDDALWQISVSQWYSPVSDGECPAVLERLG
jgi:hypothetical protein